MQDSNKSFCNFILQIHLLFCTAMDSEMESKLNKFKNLLPHTNEIQIGNHICNFMKASYVDVKPSRAILQKPKHKLNDESRLKKSKNL